MVNKWSGKYCLKKFNTFFFPKVQSLSAEEFGICASDNYYTLDDDKRRKNTLYKKFKQGVEF